MDRPNIFNDDNIFSNIDDPKFESYQWIESAQRARDWMSLVEQAHFIADNKQSIDFSPEETVHAESILKIKDVSEIDLYDYVKKMTSAKSRKRKGNFNYAAKDLEGISDKYMARSHEVMLWHFRQYNYPRGKSNRCQLCKDYSGKTSHANQSREELVMWLLEQGVEYGEAVRISNIPGLFISYNRPVFPVHTYCNFYDELVPFPIPISNPTPFSEGALQIEHNMFDAEYKNLQNDMFGYQFRKKHNLQGLFNNVGKEIAIMRRDSKAIQDAINKKTFEQNAKDPQYGRNFTLKNIAKYGIKELKTLAKNIKNKASSDSKTRKKEQTTFEKETKKSREHSILNKEAQKAKVEAEKDTASKKKLSQIVTGAFRKSAEKAKSVVSTLSSWAAKFNIRKRK